MVAGPPTNGQRRPKRAIPPAAGVTGSGGGSGDGIVEMTGEDTEGAIPAVGEDSGGSGGGAIQDAAADAVSGSLAIVEVAGGGGGGAEGGERRSASSSRPRVVRGAALTLVGLVGGVLLLVSAFRDHDSRLLTNAAIIALAVSTVGSMLVPCIRCCAELTAPSSSSSSDDDDDIEWSSS